LIRQPASGVLRVLWVLRPLLFALTAFVSAMLLFEVQPMLGKQLLPWFGGTPATWATCMLFFQVVLFAGYAFADQLVRRVPVRAQLAIELLVLGAAILLLPVGPAPALRPAALTAPVAQILGLLVRTAGLPYLALAATAPLLQHWYERATERSPYALYAFSNAGSLLGLLAYPVAVEPRLRLAQQTRAWSLGFLLFALCLLLCGLSAALPRPPRAEPVAAPAPITEPPSARQQVRWFVLSAVPSTLLLAVTNHITVDVAAVPFLWVAPLTLYLISFVLVFGSERAYRRVWFLPAWVLCTGALGIGLFAQGSASLAQQLLVPLASLFTCAMLCHGELAASRPEPAHLSRFYLLLSAGGAAGGVFVGALAPLLFSGFFELQIAVIAAYFALLSVLRDEPDSPRRRVDLRWIWLGFGLGLPLIVATVWVQRQDHTRTGTVVEQRRSFYGELRVTQLADVTLLSHGRIRHGMQLRDARRALEPTLYFGPDSGAGRALRLHALDHARRIGVLGLGVGTLASYGRAQDSVRFYEISPDVVAAARHWFSFLSGSAARVDVVVGDGRIALEREPAQHFDVLVLDAFSSDSVPTHLLTQQAFAIYLRHLRADGLLLANVSNRHLDVERAVAGSAARSRLALRIVETGSDVAHGLARVRWALMSRDRAALDRVLEGAVVGNLHGTPVFWSDDFSNLWQVLR
jgi:SAM-dependent methyltransferase